MSNELIVGAALVGGIALGMNDTVRSSVRKAGGVTASAFTAGKERFSKPEAKYVPFEQVTDLPKAAKA